MSRANNDLNRAPNIQNLRRTRPKTNLRDRELTAKGKIKTARTGYAVTNKALFRIGIWSFLVARNGFGLCHTSKMNEIVVAFRRADINDNLHLQRPGTR